LDELKEKLQERLFGKIEWNENWSFKNWTTSYTRW
jgi:hypothetical protein